VNAPNWINDAWQPSFEDVVKARVRTTGIVENVLDYRGHQLAFFDTGGERSGTCILCSHQFFLHKTKQTRLLERKKWVHVTSDHIVYVGNLVNYLGVLYEDDTVNRMDEDFKLMAEIFTAKLFTAQAGSFTFLWTHVRSLNHFRDIIHISLNVFLVI